MADMTNLVSSPSVKGGSFAYNPTNQTYNVDTRQMQFPDLMNHISKATGYTMNWDPILKNHKSSIVVKNRTLGDALPALLKDMNYSLIPDKNILRIMPPKNYKPPQIAEICGGL